MFQSGFGHSTDDDQRIFIDRDGDLFGVILASLRTGRRPSQAIVEAKRPELLDAVVLALHQQLGPLCLDDCLGWPPPGAQRRENYGEKFSV